MPSRKLIDGQRDGADDHAAQHRPRAVLDHLGRAPGVGPLDLDLAGVLDRDVGLEVLLGDLAQGAVVAELLERLVGLRAQVRVGLAEGECLTAHLVPGVAHDLDVLGARRRQVVEHRDVVVDDGVDPSLHEQLGRLGEALDRPDVGAGVARDLRPVAGLRLRGRLALQVGERLDVVGVRGGDDDAVRVGVGLGEQVPRLALGVDRDLVGDHVDPVGVEGREDRVERALHELQLPAGLLRDRLDDLDVVAGQLLRARDRRR